MREHLLKLVCDQHRTPIPCFCQSRPQLRYGLPARRKVRDRQRRFPLPQRWVSAPPAPATISGKSGVFAKCHGPLLDLK